MRRIKVLTAEQRAGLCAYGAGARPARRLGALTYVGVFVLAVVLASAALGCKASKLAGPDAGGCGTLACRAGSQAVAGNDAAMHMPDASTQAIMPDASHADAGAAIDSGAAVGNTGLLPDGGRNFTTDRSGYLGASRCAAAGLALCDDFEAQAVGGMPDSSLWMLGGWGSNMSAAIDDTHAARGKHALHFHTEAKATQLFITETKTFPAANNRFFGRMFLYVDKVPKPFDPNNQSSFPLVHWTAAQATGTYMEGGKSYQPQVRAIGGINQRLLINVDGGPNHEQGVDDMPPAGHEALPEKTWVCFEYEYSGVGEQAELRVYWDSVEHEHLHLMNTSAGGAMPWPIPSYESASFGWALYQDYSAIMPSGFDVWIDEVAIDSQRIGCSL